MKITTQRKVWSGILLLLVIVAGACKKDKEKVVIPTLLGAWMEVVRFDGPLIRYRTMGLLNDSLITFTTHNVSNGSYVLTTVTSIYHTDGQKLITNFKEMVVSEFGTGKIISKGPVSGKYLDNATYVLDATSLTINYTDYISDGPVPAVIVFNRPGLD